MGMVVNHNIPALISYNAVSRTNNALQKSIQKLSTGLRINSAADDAAGLAISEKMRAQIRGLDRAVANSQDGISMIQTAEGALNETHSILQRMRELSVQSANDTLTQQDRGYIQLEIDQLREEITRIGNTTQFNKKKLLNGDAAVLWSSDNLKTRAIVNGGLRQIDQFGQKNALEGNYKIKIEAEAGQGEVKKSDLFKIKHKNVIYNKSVNTAAGIKDVSVNNVPAGDYTVTNATPGNSAVALTGQFNVGASITTQEKATIEDNDVTNTAGNGVGKFTVTLAGFNGGAAYDLGLTVAEGAKTSQQAIAQALVKAINGKKLDDGSVISASYTNATGAHNDGKLKIQAVNRDGTASTLKIDIAAVGGHADLATAANALDFAAGTPKDMTFAEAITQGGDKTKLTTNANILFEVSSVDKAADTVTLKARVATLNTDGTTGTKTTTIVLRGGAAAPDINIGDQLGIGSAESFSLALEAGAAGAFVVGSKFTYNVGLGTDANGGLPAKADATITIGSTQNQKWEGNWGASIATSGYGLKADSVKGKDVSFNNYYLNEKTGEVMEGAVTLSFNDKYKAGTGEVVSTFSAAYVGETANGDVRLRDLDKFWDAQGRFMLTDPQTITMTQGDGKQTKITLYANDTLNDVAKKFNEAIASGLGQSQYVTGDASASHFATFVSKAGSGDEAVAGTFVLRSIVPGSNGTLSLAGDEDVINAFSLNVIQKASESTYRVGVEDAHTGNVVASERLVTGNKLIGVVNPNIDVEFDAMAGVSAKWDAVSGSYKLTSKQYETVLHLADNTTVFQIGANEGEDMGINIGDMRAQALGLNAVLVTDRESAARSITVIDNALDKVSTQRAKLGAYQNRLEHTINNLTVAGENLTAAESRIRDTDMAKEMMNFTKLNIMLQAGNAMLAQANQLPQNVLSLIR